MLRTSPVGSKKGKCRDKKNGVLYMYTDLRHFLFVGRLIDPKHSINYINKRPIHRTKKYLASRVLFANVDVHDQRSPTCTIKAKPPGKECPVFSSLMSAQPDDELIYTSVTLTVD